MLPSGPASAVGLGLTSTSTELPAEQPFESVTTTLYIVLTTGVATGLEIVLELKDTVGLQL
jgi:hypothetical protein